MRFAAFAWNGAELSGVLEESDGQEEVPQSLHVLTDERGPIDVSTLLSRGGTAALRDAGGAALARRPGPRVDEVVLRAPLRPASIRDSVSFEAHVEGARRSQEGATDPVPARWYEAPCFYFTNPHVCHGPFEDVRRFPDSALFDLECEVGVVYGEHGSNLTPERAAAGIVGYTIFNDWSARDIQRLEGRLPFGFFKGKDGAHTLGPYLVTADELEPYRTGDGFLDLTMRAYINGELLGEDSLANMAWTFEELISFASRGSAVAPGDVLGSGTCQRGCLTEIWGRTGERTPPPLVPGDVVTLTVEGLGTVRNRVVEAEEQVPEIPRARRGRPRGPRH
ncbi:MAG TPA: fumarylacetoacetate hydrolase family protein [Actinospica sp.]|jgi:2-keto-4-pentenoate hydratase/2-oxohepta-3-ene-1,7-dioic acid hydratase in catechol pathway|nr:fumarylacetoacetate hydrolase family protein [Actinospica sp.]